MDGIPCGKLPIGTNSERLNGSGGSSRPQAQTAPHTVTDVISWGRMTGREDRRWTLVLESQGFRLETSNSRQNFAGTEAGSLSVRRSWFRRALVVMQVGSASTYRGLSRGDASALEGALARYLSRAQLATELLAVVAWANRANTTIGAAESNGRWIPQETNRSLESSMPHQARDRILSRGRTWQVSTLTPVELAALGTCKSDIGMAIEEANERIFVSELANRRDFFDR